MSSVPSLSFNELRAKVEALGFDAVRQRGSHIRYAHPDGRVTTIPDHGNKDVPRGLLHGIVRKDLKMSWHEFLSVKYTTNGIGNRLVDLVIRGGRALRRSSRGGWVAFSRNPSNRLLWNSRIDGKSTNR